MDVLEKKIFGVVIWDILREIVSERNVILENVKFVFRNFIIEGNVF